MSCSQCYTAQVPECIEFLIVYADINDGIAIDLFARITTSQGNVYYQEAGYSPGGLKIDFSDTTVFPKNLLTRYSGSFTIEAMVSKDSNESMPMKFCGSDIEYNCIEISRVIHNSNSVKVYNIGCES